MTCEEYQEQIVLWQRGELEPAAAAAVRRHVEACVACRAAFEAEEALTARLREARRHAAPPGLQDRVAGALRRPARAAWRPRLWGQLVPAAVGALVAALVSVPVTWWLGARPAAPIVVLAREVAHEHERGEITLPWGRPALPPEAARASLATWLEMGFPQPPLVGEGLSLVSARATYVFGRKAGAFVYQDAAGRMVTLFVFRGTDVELPERGRVQVEKFKPYFSTADGLTLCVWKQKDVGFSMVAKKSQEELAQDFLKIRKSL